MRSQRRSSIGRAEVVGLLAVLLGTGYVYSRTLDYWFVADDFLFLRAAQSTSWGSWLAQSLDFRDRLPVPDFTTYRPVYLFVFKLEYSLFGLNEVFYHAANVGGHLTAVSLFWLVACRLTRTSSVALAATAVFALHPAYWDAIGWVSNGNSLLAVLAILASILAVMLYTERERERERERAVAMDILGSRRCRGPYSPFRLGPGSVAPNVALHAASERSYACRLHGAPLAQPRDLRRAHALDRSA